MNIIISGANSGLGQALAQIYASKDNNLFLCARNQERLLDVKNKCQDLGAKVEIKKIDVRDKKQVKSWIDEIAKNHKIDLVIANAGISAGTGAGFESDQQVSDIFATNIDGVLNIINPAISYMKQQKSGQVAIISSLAGFRGLPGCPAYSASKACVRVYGEALRGALVKYNIKVNVICPGYIKTPMTAVNNFPMPLIMPATKAAKIIKKGLNKNKSQIAFPFAFYFVVLLASFLSKKITDPIFQRLPGK